MPDERIAVSDLKSELGDLIKNTQDIFTTSSDEERKQTAETWLQWCKQNKNVKVIEYEIPGGILPSHLSGQLFDAKVDTRGPDDALYNRDTEIRKKVARGNTLLRLRNAASKENSLEFVVFALRKFTGGMGDEDENQPEDDTVWKRYFLKPFEESKSIVVLEKENGEAAHLSVRYIEGTFYLIGGSKNVHLIFRNHEDIEKYKESRFQIAKVICKSIVDSLNSMDHQKKIRLLSLLSWTKMTVIMEVLQPDYQHVVDLSYLSQPELKFLCFTEPYTEKENHTSLTSLPPNIALEIGRKFGLNPTKYEIITVDQFEEEMKKVRLGRGYEGAVFYFLDEDNNTIGLLKKKTIWYILLRAIREKVSYAVTDYKKNPGGFRETEKLKCSKKIEKRIDEIQKWLGLTPDETKNWKSLGIKYLVWIMDKVSQGAEYGDRSKFPVHWNQFLAEKNLSDGHKEVANTEANDKGDSVVEEMEEDKPVKFLEHHSTSPIIKVADSNNKNSGANSSTLVVGCIFRNMDLVGKNLKKFNSIIERINSKSLKKKKGYIAIYDLDKLHSNIVVKLEGKDSVDGFESSSGNGDAQTIENLVPVIYAGNKVIGSPDMMCPETEVVEDTMNLLAIYITPSFDNEKKILETLILQVYHSGVGSRSSRKGITVEKVKIEYENGDVEFYPENLNLPLS